MAGLVPGLDTASKREKPARVLVQLQPHPFPRSSRRQRRASVEALGVGERFERAGQRALALAGGVVAIYFTGNLSMGAMVGFVTLFGITTRNTIMLVELLSTL